METIKLSGPVSKGERTITELTFADPKVRHLLSLDGHNPDDYAAVVALASALTGEPELLIGELPPEDWRKVRAKTMSVYYDFLGIDFAALAAEAAKEDPAKKDPTKATEQPKA